MKDGHITQILDDQNLAAFSAEEIQALEAHAGDCAACGNALRAARLASLMLKFDAERRELVEPTPFFQAKVMNAVRARQRELKKPIAAFRRWWQASFAPVCLMLLTVACLIALSLFAPATADDEATAVVPNNLYTTDAVIMNQSNRRELTNEQVFRVIYNPRYEPNRK